MHAAYFANIAAYNHAGISMPLDKEGQRRLGFTLIRIGVDNIPNTLNLIRDDGSFDYGAVTGFSATDLAVLLSYSWKAGFLPGLSLGTNLKVIYRGAGNFANSWGFGLDLAAQYHRNGLQLGLVLRDATGTFNAWTFNTETFEEAFINTGNEVPQNSVLRTPPSLRLGIAYDFTLATRLKLLVSVDGDMYFDGQRASLVNIGRTTLDPHMGLEFAFLNQDRNPLVFLRGGMYNLQNVKNLDGEDAFGLFPTAGVGVVIKNFQIDYALANIGNLSQNLHSHVVSLQFHLGKNAD
jgi:hypothetical protein